MPLLLRGLDLPDAEIRANIIDTLLATADTTAEKNTTVSEHAASLVSTMLKNSMFKDSPSVVSLFISIDTCVSLIYFVSCRDRGCQH